MTTLPTLPTDCIGCILHYADRKTLWKCRAVNKQFKTFSEMHLFTGNQKDYLNMMKPLHDNVSALRQAQQTLAKQEKALAVINLTFVERMLYSLNRSYPSVVSKLHLLPILGSVFSMVQFTQQLKVENTIADAKKQVEQYQRKQQAEESSFQRKRANLQNLQAVHDLFGGYEAYLKLPTFSLEGYDYGDYIETIDVKDLTAPIMRGIDRYSRNFFVLRATNQKAKYLLFAQRYSHDYSTWIAKEDKDITNPDNNILPKGTHSVYTLSNGISDYGGFDLIKTLIQTGKLQSWTLF